MAPSIGFVVYASSPDMVGQTIEGALEIYAARQGRDRFASWRENDIAGHFVVDPILDNIAASQCLVADISTLNFNVAYEIGYAIGRGKRAVLVKNKAVAMDETELRRVGIFDTLGYLTYENAEELYRLLASLKEFTPLKIGSAPSFGAPVYILQLPFNIDAQTRIVARVKKARLRFRSFDPAEQSRLPADRERGLILRRHRPTGAGDNARFSRAQSPCRFHRRPRSRHGQDHHPCSGR